MKNNSVTTETATAISTGSKSVQERFIVFVAGGISSIVSFENFARAEYLAVIFANLTSVRMEVFDSAKDVCYFIEPAPHIGALVH